MTANRTERPPSAPRIDAQTQTSSDALPGRRAVALLVAAVALSVVASMIATSPRGGNDAAGAATPATGSAPAADAEPVAAAEPKTAEPIFRDPADVSTPVGARAPQTVTLDLTTTEVERQLADGTTYTYWTFNDTVPGPMLRVREGDTVELSLSNAADSTNPHSVDLHAVNGPGGGAEGLQVPPGETKSISFKALNPGVYVYHCATPHIPSHIANGMYGLIVVEPEGGLEPVDREFYVMQGEIYTDGDRGAKGHVGYDADEMMSESPDYVVFNGAVAALTGDNAMQAEVGETVRLFVGNGGPNLTSNFHVIGEIFDRARVEGGSLVNENVQTTLIPAGGATWVEFTIDVPGNYLLVDHAITRTIDKGALAIISATGSENPAVYDAPDAQPEGEAPAADEPAEDSAQAASGTVDVSMTEFAFGMPSEIAAGEVSFEIVNDGAVPHEFAISPQGTHDEHIESIELNAGESGTIDLDLAPGTYEIGCHLPGHFEAGMKATVDVT